MLNKMMIGALLSGVALFAVHTAMAADMVAPAPAPSLANTLSIELSPEFATTDSSNVDNYVKLGLSHSFSNNFVLGGTFAYTQRTDAASTSYEQFETSLGYKIKSGAFTLTPAVLVGVGVGTPKINAAVATESDAYYAVSLAGDMKLNDSLTWNVFNARYRNAFSTTWITPKIATGFTYKIDASDSVYISAGYAWKDKGLGAGLLGDKWNIAVGYKYSF